MLTAYLWFAWHWLMSQSGHTIAMGVIGLIGVWSAVALYRTVVEARRSHWR